MNKNRNTFAIAVSTILILLLMASTAWNVQSAQKETHKVAETVSNFYIEELTNRRVVIISDVLKQNFQYLNNALDIITEKNLSSIDSLRNYLRRIRRLYGLEKFSFVDEDGLIYTANSTSTGISRYPFLVSGLSESLVTTVRNYGGENLLFIALPVSEIQFKDKKIVACFAQVNIDQMGRSMTFSVDGMETYFNLYMKNGESLTNAPFGGVEQGRNLLTVIHENDKSGEASSRIVEDFKNERSGSISVPYKRQNAHLYYAPVEETGWMLTILVYDNAITAQIKSNNKKIIARNHLQILITVISVIFIFSILIVTMKRNSQMEIELEKRIVIETKTAYEKLNKETQGMQIIHFLIHSGPWSIDFDENGEISHCSWSQPFRQMLGFNSIEEFPDEFSSWADRLHPADKDRILVAYWNTIHDTTGSYVYDVEYRLMTKENGYRWYHAAGNLIRHPDGSPDTFVGLFVDIDERKTLKTLSETDLMTGLLNRVSGEKRTDFVTCYKLVDEGVYESKKVQSRSAVTIKSL